jgi:Uma2 family endonuclease
MKDIDLDITPIEGGPTLAVEVISQSNLAQDTTKKVRQYLAAGSHAVWLIYPALRLVEIHDKTGMREVAEPETIGEQKLFDGAKFSVSLTVLFEDNPRQ